MTTETLLESIQAKAMQIGDTYNSDINKVVKDMSDHKERGFGFLFGQRPKNNKHGLEDLNPHGQARVEAVAENTVFQELAEGRLPFSEALKALEPLNQRIPSQIDIEPTSAFEKSNELFEKLALKAEATATSNKPQF